MWLGPLDAGSVYQGEPLSFADLGPLPDSLCTPSLASAGVAAHARLSRVARVRCSRCRPSQNCGEPLGQDARILPRQPDSRLRPTTDEGEGRVRTEDEDLDVLRLALVDADRDGDHRGP